MRRGLMKWDEDRLPAAEVASRVERLRAALADDGLDAFLSYTTLVRPAAVHYLTGFTPYWSDGLLLVTRQEGRPVFVTALSKRVGTWLGGVNPTCEIAHAPRPGREIAKVLAQRGVRRLGLLEPDMMPGELVEDLQAADGVELVDASGLFAKLRAAPSAVETRLALQAEEIARQAFQGLAADAANVGQVVGPLERAVRLQGAEECYIAIAPDLGRDMRLARRHGSEPLGELFAARVSVAFSGVWVRFTRTLRRGAGLDGAEALEDLAAGLDASQPLQSQISAAAAAAGLSVDRWSLEAPVGTRPLKQVADETRPGPAAIPYGVLSLAGRHQDRPFLFSGVLPGGDMKNSAKAEPAGDKAA